MSETGRGSTETLHRAVGRRRRVASTLLLGALAALPAPSHLRAQAPQGPGSRWAVDVAGGIGIPGNILREEVNPGPAVAAAVSLALGRHAALRLGVDATFQGGKELTDTFGPGGVPLTRGPDLTIVHYMAGAELLPLPPSQGPVWLALGASAGVTSISGSENLDGEGPWPTAGAAARLGWRASSRIGPWVGAALFVYVVSPGGEVAIDTDAPVLAGVRVRL